MPRGRCACRGLLVRWDDATSSALWSAATTRSAPGPGDPRRARVRAGGLAPVRPQDRSMADGAGWHRPGHRGRGDLPATAGDRVGGGVGRLLGRPGGTAVTVSGAGPDGLRALPGG